MKRGTSGGVAAGERFDQEKPIQIANCCSGALLWKDGSSIQQSECVSGIAIETLEEIYVRARKFEKMRLNIAPSQVAFTGGSE